MGRSAAYMLDMLSALEPIRSRLPECIAPLFVIQHKLAKGLEKRLHRREFYNTQCLAASLIALSRYYEAVVVGAPTSAPSVVDVSYGKIPLLSEQRVDVGQSKSLVIGMKDVAPSPTLLGLRKTPGTPAGLLFACPGHRCLIRLHFSAVFYDINVMCARKTEFSVPVSRNFTITRTLGDSTESTPGYYHHHIVCCFVCLHTQRNISQSDSCVRECLPCQVGYTGWCECSGTQSFIQVPCCPV